MSSGRKSPVAPDFGRLAECHREMGASFTALSIAVRRFWSLEHEARRLRKSRRGSWPPSR